MKKDTYIITKNQEIAPEIYKMELQGDVTKIEGPGEFVEVKLDGLFLRRPISVHDVYENGFSLIYKNLGKGTEKMSLLNKGVAVDILTGLGNGFNTEKCGEKPILVGGGVGVPPLYYLAKELLKKGKKPRIILGFNTEKEIFLETEFKDLGLEVDVTTIDGSYGTKGLVTDVIKNIKDGDYTYFYACGPLPMLKALESIAQSKGELSLEERMGCGFGACMGCSIKTIKGHKRVCKEGPVFSKGEVIWED